MWTANLHKKNPPNPGCEEHSCTSNVLLIELQTVTHSFALGHVAAHQGRTVSLLPMLCRT